MMEFYQVDAFAENIFEGNPAAVFVLEKEASESWMKNVASEMNLSETAFLYSENHGFNLKWFTPEKEVPLCGHATLASSHILWETNRLNINQTATFYTKSGELKANKKDGLIELNFPKVGYKKTEITDEIKKVIKSNIIQASITREDLLIELGSENEIKKFNPDFNAIINLPFRGVIITAKGDNEFDFVSRFFVPKLGINEDPVTGSAHCCLTEYWNDKLKKESFKAYQASKRGGIVNTKINENRVFLSGKAITVFKGFFN